MKSKLFLSVPIIMVLLVLVGSMLVFASSEEPVYPNDSVSRNGSLPEKSWSSFTSSTEPFHGTSTVLALGEPGLSFGYVDTYGMTLSPYISDTQHVNRPTGLYIELI